MDGAVVVEAAGVGVHHRAKELGERTKGGARTQHPAPEAGVDVADRVGVHVLEKFLVHLLGRLGVERERTAKVGLDLVWDMLPGRLHAQRLCIVQHIVDHAVTELPQ